MEVTRKNFKESLPIVAASIKKADFLVIDAEFTGLINGRDVNIFDSPQEYYLTLLHGSTEFLLIQFGLCAFYWDVDEKKYINEAYNFYLFPRGRPGPEKTFLCQSSSLDFLVAQGFDFNKLIREGISYMTEPTETRLRENLSERQKTYTNEKESIRIPEENRSQIEDICKKVRIFLDENQLDEMEIDRCNAFVRRLLFQEIGTRFKDRAFLETKVLENKDRVLKVTRLKSQNDTKVRDAQKKEKEWEEFEDAVGFSKVARMISQSEKLVVGHNMLLDVLHTLNHFFQPLPLDYKTFKEFAHCMFPRLLDTKYMSSLPPFKDKVNSSVLSHLLATLSEPPFSVPNADSKDGSGYSRHENKHHEAGYDAYITGLCFLAMHSHLARMRGDRDMRVCAPDGGPTRGLAGGAIGGPAGDGGPGVVLKPFLNKLYLAKTAYQDSPYINLAGADPSPSRDHVFHLTFPKEWQRNDINQLFSAYGQITVQFLDETSAFVALTRKDLAKTMARAFASNSRVMVVPYHKYKMIVNKTSRPVLRRENIAAVTPDSSRKLPGMSNHTSTGVTPEKSRARSNSVSASAPPARKRTSSGVFQVEESEPPPKKSELAQSKAEESQKVPEATANGRRKISKNPTETQSEKRKPNQVLEKFVTNNKVDCVSAFKESDSWD